MVWAETATAEKFVDRFESVILYAKLPEFPRPDSGGGRDIDPRGCRSGPSQAICVYCWTRWRSAPAVRRIQPATSLDVDDSTPQGNVDREVRSFIVILAK